MTHETWGCCKTTSEKEVFYTSFAGLGVNGSMEHKWYLKEKNEGVLNLKFFSAHVARNYNVFG